ncbi:MAG: type II secretion system protein GspD [Verrucomicrobia bacterium]|jgi:type II secretory pathway component HofQ|nr:type II secretion system protein GspD [Verrucomicrobiota bacterium]
MKPLVAKKLALAVIGILYLGCATVGAQETPESTDSSPQPPPEKYGAEHVLKNFQLTNSTIVDAARLVSELSGVNIVATEAAGAKTVTLFLQNVKAEKAIEVMCRVADLWYRKDQDVEIYRILTTEEYQKDIVVHKEDITRVFTLLHENVISTATAIADLFGERVILSLGSSGGMGMVPGGGGMMGGGMSGGMGGAMGGGGMIGGGGLGGAMGGLGGGGRGGGGFGGGGFGGGLSRSGGGMQGMGSGMSRQDAPTMTTEQIANLEALLMTRAGNQRPTETDLKQITGQEPDIYVTINSQHNLILVRTSDEEAIKDIEILMIELDRPIPQVLLEMKVLELTLGDGFKAAFDLEGVDQQQTGGPPTSQIINPLNTGLGTVGRNVAATGRFPLEDNRFVYQFLNDRFRARVQVMASENRVQELATPMILAANNKQARIFIGEERVLTTGVNTSVVTPGNGATTSTIEPVTEIRDIGNTVVILPHINEDRTVTLTITQDSSSVAVGAATIPVAGGGGTVTSFNVDTVNTARIEGTIVATNNLTVAIGGLIRQRMSESRQKVPVLGDIPVLGSLFRRDVKENTKTELILLITPRVMRTPAEGQKAIQDRIRSLSDHPYHEKLEAAIPRPKITFDKKGRKVIY